MSTNVDLQELAIEREGSALPKATGRLRFATRYVLPLTT